MSIRCLLSVWLGLIGVLPFNTVTASEWSEQLGLSAGSFLVAAPQLRDHRFARTVVLLVDYGAGGARGVIVNRPGSEDLSRDFGDRLRADVAAQPLYYGGPVGLQHRLMLADFRAPEDGAFEVVPGVFFIHGRRLINSLSRVPEQGGHYRVFRGFAGWGPLQLEHEVARGDWFVVPGSKHYALEMAPEALWGELMRFYEAQMAVIEASPQAVDS